jgi:pentatricopeptide repeat protein
MRSPLSSITSEEQAEFDALAKPNTGAVQPSGSPHPRPRRNSVNVASIIAEPNDLSPVIEGVRLSPSPPPTVSMQNAVAAWNGRIACLFEESRAAEALSLLDIMLQDNTPRPEASTYAVVIQGFCRLGDLGSALGWFERLLYQPPTSYAPRPNRESWTAILRCLVEKRDVLTVNSLFPALLTSTPAIKVEAEDFELLLKANTTSVHSFTIAKGRF